MADGSIPRTNVCANEPEIFQIANDAMVACNGDTDAAIDAVMHAVEEMPAIREKMIRESARHYVWNVIGALRKATFDGASSRSASSSPLSSSEVSSRERQNGNLAVRLLGAGNLLMFPLPETAKPLGEATKEEVAQAAHFYSVRSKCAAAKSRWLDLVAAQLESGQRVNAALGERRLKELKVQAGGDE